jgi:hypothetical protein
MATNSKSFYYRKDLNVTKHGEYKASVEMPFGSAVKRNDANGTIELAASSAEFEGIADKIIYNVQGNDSLVLEADERGRIGVGKDYEFVTKGAVSVTGAKGDEVAVVDGAFVAPVAGTNEPVGKIIEKFPNGETVIRIY